MNAREHVECHCSQCLGPSSLEFAENRKNEIDSGFPRFLSRRTRPCQVKLCFKVASGEWTAEKKEVVA